MYHTVRSIWLRISLKNKIGIFAAMVILIMGLSAAFNIGIMNFSLDEFSNILNDNSRCHDFQEALDLEIGAFEDYIRDRTPENREQYIVACVRTERCIRSLPFDYISIGPDRYARTWNIKNGYEGYSASRDVIADMERRNERYVEDLYKVYEMQNYLQNYARKLVQATLKDGNAAYQKKVPVFSSLPMLILMVSILLMVAVLCLTRVLSQTLVRPLVTMARSTRRIGKNDFSDPDLEIDNRDEMGELVQAFNKMKHSTEGYINTLKEKNEMAVRLHKEEVERIETEKRLDAARLELLKSQINPHFLFNTLNMIACMAKLEEAATTEKMITSMSSLFRYNLKTSAQIVPLAQEMGVVQDYMYIQQMRFGSRIRYTTDLSVDSSQVMIPAFTLQPMVENAIIHGLSKKEQGGRIHLRVWRNRDRVVISVADTGLGIDEERLEELRQALKNCRTARVGIGLGNIYQRIHAMYQEGRVYIYSTRGRGTVIQMVIPQTGRNEE